MSEQECPHDQLVSNVYVEKAILSGDELKPSTEENIKNLDILKEKIIYRLRLSVQCERCSKNFMFIPDTVHYEDNNRTILSMMEEPELVLPQSKKYNSNDIRDVTFTED